nr:MAG TPA: hypothetical protein [Caudoviricetes sp.]
MNELTITEYKEIRVLTTQQIAEAYETDRKTISYNFNRNKDRYIEGKHYIQLEGKDKAEFINRLENHDSLKNAKTLYLWTEKGAFLHAKSLNTDKAWEVYDKLVDSYFKKTTQRTLTAVEQLQLQSQAILEVNDKIDEVKQELEDFKQDMPLMNIECDRITTAVRKVGTRALGGKDSNAYHDKSLSGKVYTDIYRELKRQFQVTSYKSIKRRQCDTAISIIERYELPVVLKEQIQNTNAQISMEV